MPTTVTTPPTPPTPDLADLLAQAAAGGRAVVEYAGQRLALIGPDDLTLLETTDDADDAALAKVAQDAREQWAADGYPTIPMAEVKRRLGLD